MLRISKLTKSTGKSVILVVPVPVLSLLGLKAGDSMVWVERDGEVLVRSLKLQGAESAKNGSVAEILKELSNIKGEIERLKKKEKK